MKLKFYSDLGHGWLAVKRSLLKKLGILNKITPYSYQKGNTVYLEEDCDAGTFLDAVKNEMEITIEDKYCERSPIRSYESFELTKLEDFSERVIKNFSETYQNLA